MLAASKARRASSSIPKVSGMGCRRELQCEDSIFGPAKIFFMPARRVSLALPCRTIAEEVVGVLSEVVLDGSMDLMKDNMTDQESWAKPVKVIYQQETE
jgi:hypothetical protein